MQSHKAIISYSVIALIVVIIGVIEWSSMKGQTSQVSAIPIISPQTESTMEKSKKYPPAKELVAPSGFINSEPFALADFIGKKVILLDIWTYSCINCQRTLPYISEWNDKYADQGLLIIGIHSPEFDFEKKLNNVQAAVDKFGITYPVVLDNDFGTWRAYQNSYWPRKYLIDIDGYVVYDHIGEGGYQETERKIQELLKERALRFGEDVSVNKSLSDITVSEAITDTSPRSPETYFGTWRNDTFGNGTPKVEGGFELVAPTVFAADKFYLDGSWNIHREYIENARSGGRLIYRYRGDKVFMVASSAESANVTVLQDGKPIDTAGGVDVDSTGVLHVKDETLYKVVDNPDGAKEHVLELIFDTPGVHIFTFTFG